MCEKIAVLLLNNPVSLKEQIRRNEQRFPDRCSFCSVVSEDVHFMEIKPCGVRLLLFFKIDNSDC